MPDWESFQVGVLCGLVACPFVVAGLFVLALPVATLWVRLFG